MLFNAYLTAFFFLSTHHFFPRQGRVACTTEIQFFETHSVYFLISIVYTFIPPILYIKNNLKTTQL